ncbi:uncharacterized protein LOC121368207 [Gigantopelta aegis]|uniref:uncharacterized protein LOC121368207 n=1 Tax=Gigantopelta aegis TaxID=1735272 RepID=UPI001B88A722|nr:uncharacterized protein LOC121368207 [Gigantopelta aegis]
MKFTMSCLWCKPPSEMPPIIDVEKVIQDYVWGKVKGDRHPLARMFMRRSDYDIEVPHNYFHFEDIEEDVVEDTKPSPKHPARSRGKEAKPIPEMSVVCTEFRNNTETEQTFQFRFQKTRNASVNVTFQKGFTIGGKAHFKLGLPKHLADSSAGGEVNLKYQVTKTTGETFDESVTIEANSEIRVVKQRKYIAKVSLAERQFSGTFRVETLMKMPSGSAPIFVRRKRNQELLCIESISDLKSVFAGLPVEVEDVSKPSQREASYAVKFVTTGIIEGVRLLGQKIYLDSEQLDEADSFTVAMPKSVEDFISGPARDKLSDVMESSTDSASQESGQGGLKHQPETKILKDPEIPQIITTAPSSLETSPRSVQNYNTTDQGHSTMTSPLNETQNTGAQIPQIRLPDSGNVRETNEKPTDNSVTVTTSTDRSSVPRCECAPKAEPELADVGEKNKDKTQTLNEVAQPKIKAEEIIKPTSKIEPELSKMKIVDVKRLDGNKHDLKQTTKSKFLLKQSARFEPDVKQTSKNQSDIQQTTRCENPAKQNPTARTEPFAGQTTTRQKLNERQTTQTDADKKEWKKTDMDSKRTRSMDVNITRSMDVNIYQSRTSTGSVMDVDSEMTQSRARERAEI